EPHQLAEVEVRRADRLAQLVEVVLAVQLGELLAQSGDLLRRRLLAEGVEGAEVFDALKELAPLHLVQAVHVLKAGGLQAPFLLTHHLEALELFGRRLADQNGGRLHRVALDVDGVTGRDGESLHEVGGHTGLESAVAVLEDEDVLEGGHRVDAQRGAEAHHVLDGGRITCDVLRHRSEEHTSELQSREKLVCRLLLEKKNPEPVVKTAVRGASEPVPAVVGTSKQRSPFAGSAARHSTYLSTGCSAPASAAAALAISRA